MKVSTNPTCITASGRASGLRNENLVFNTIELRMVYFPQHTLQNISFQLLFTTGLQFRFNNTYVRQPDVVLLNTDGLNTVY